MINQGENAHFKGSFEQLVGDSWETLSLTGNTIIVLVYNEATGKKVTLSSKDGSVTINSDNSYEFDIPGTDTAQMIGEVSLELALIDSSGNPLITDYKGKFNIFESQLGRQLSNS